MRSYDEENKEENERTRILPWQVELLKLNPDYISWGNYEDGLSNKDSGWSSPIWIDSVDELWEQDNLNVVVDFYFEVERKSEECKTCDGSGYNDETGKLSDSWYAFDDAEYRQNPYNKNARYNIRAWENNIGQVEVDKLWDCGRLNSYFKSKPTPKEVNEWNLKGMGHDSINKSICIKARAEDMGVYGECEVCGGSGYNYVEEEAKVGLQLWILHPRKGTSQGLYLRDIKEEDIPTIMEYLKEARKSFLNRFSKIEN